MQRPRLPTAGRLSQRPGPRWGRELGLSAVLIAVMAGSSLVVTRSPVRSSPPAAAARATAAATLGPGTPAPALTPGATAAITPGDSSPAATPVPSASAAAPPPPPPTLDAAPSGSAAASPPAVPSAPAHRHLEWGVYVPDFPGSVAGIDAAERAAGRHADVVTWYVHWGGPWSAYNAADVRAVLARGSTPMITWMSDDPSASGYPGLASQAAYRPADIAAGRYDAYIRSWAAGLRDAGGTVLLRLDHEMNGNWYAWSPGSNGSTAADYVAMWRHVHDVVAAAGAGNVRWVWSPNVAYPGSAPLASLYPGDAYVDRAGVDGYNWGPSDPAHSWQSFSAIFDATLAAVQGITARPLSITETASTEVGGDKAAWIRDLFAELAGRAGITGLAWFDAAKETDWRFDSSAAAGTAFAAGLAAAG